MSKTYLLIPDQHAHSEYNNDRADWMGKLIKDVKPDVVVNIGDAADVPSLSSFDKGKASFASRNYEKDIEAHLDFQERMWAPIKHAKKKQPYRVILEGNHEHRVKKALEYSPELGGDRFGISMNDFDFKKYYHEFIEYEGQTPGIWESDGISFAHFFISGVMGRPIGGVHHASSLINKNYKSSVCGHSHTVDWAVRTDTSGKQIMGLVGGVYQDYDSPWAGKVNNLWWRGCSILHDVEDGVFNPQFVSIKKMKEIDVWLRNTNSLRKSLSLT
jgi:hypothetical protein